MDSSRKRARDEIGDDAEIVEAKRRECANDDGEKRYEFYDGIGVFDFPWLKEGVIFNSEPYFEDEEEKFAPCLYLDEDFVQEIPCVDPNFDDCKNDEKFWSLIVDDLDIWSCVIDHPLDLGFSKR